MSDRDNEDSRKDQDDPYLSRAKDRLQDTRRPDSEETLRPYWVLADRLGQRAIRALALALAGLSILLLFRIQSPAVLAAFVILFGVALGGSAVLFPLLVGEYFGLVAFARILSGPMSGHGGANKGAECSTSTGAPCPGVFQTQACGCVAVLGKSSERSAARK